MPTLSENHLVQKRNALVEMRNSDMTLQELRFLALYMSKIDKDRSETRVVRFPLAEYQALLGLGRIDVGYMKGVTDALLQKVVSVDIEDENGKKRGYHSFQLFRECKVTHDGDGEWYLAIDAHESALPLMFDFKNRFMSYRVGNVLRLGSKTQYRMYELLKQYEKIGWRVFSVEDLKMYLGVKKDDYDDRWDNFKRRVLDSCQRALRENTDIKFTYAPHGKKGKGGKILELIFHIDENGGFPPPTAFDESEATADVRSDATDALGGDSGVEGVSGEVIGGVDGSDGGGLLIGRTLFDRKTIEYYMTACENEFEFDEVVMLLFDIERYAPQNVIDDFAGCYEYLRGKYRELLIRSKRTRIKHRHAYLRRMISTQYAT